MLSSKRKRARMNGVLGPIARTLVITFTVAAAGCSADVTRFGYSSSNNSTSSIPIPPEPIRNGYAPSGPPRGLGLTEAPLPPSDFRSDYRPPSRPYDDPPPTTPSVDNRFAPTEQPDTYRVVGRKYASPAPPPRSSEPPQWMASPRVVDPNRPEANDKIIDVQPGETLYGIGRRYGVSPSAIKDANGLTSDNVRPGQRLVLPAGAQDRATFGRAPALAEEERPAQTKYAPPAPERTASLPPPPAGPAPAVQPPPGWEGRYTMKNGDSLYGIAYRYKVTLEELKRANGITDPTKVWAGTVLNVPAQTDAPATTTRSTTTVHVPTAPPRIINAAPDAPAPEQKRAALDTPSEREPQTADAGAARFRWPVRGKIIAGFGRRPDGTHNDGVNITVPRGTEIHAAEGGKVAYAGNELKGYGNLVLIRHPNGWVTAYAHADQLLVRKDDEVRRGQLIATAGRTGAVDQPQVHFELRQGSRPVDPLPHLAN